MFFEKGSRLCKQTLTNFDSSKRISFKLFLVQNYFIRSGLFLIVLKVKKLDLIKMFTATDQLKHKLNKLMSNPVVHS